MLIDNILFFLVLIVFKNLAVYDKAELFPTRKAASKKESVWFILTWQRTPFYTAAPAER